MCLTLKYKNQNIKYVGELYSLLKSKNVNDFPTNDMGYAYIQDDECLCCVDWQRLANMLNDTIYDNGIYVSDIKPKEDEWFIEYSPKPHDECYCSI